MLQKKNTVKIIGGVIAIVLLAGGYYFLKGSKLLSKEKMYYAYFTDVQGLAPSSPVNIRGVRIGRIADVELSNKHLVKIILSVHNNIQLPEGTVARLASGGLTGDKAINLVLGKSSQILPEYATLITDVDTSLLPVSVRFTPVFETMKSILRGTDTTLNEFNLLISTKMISKTAIGVIRLEEKTKGFAKASASLNTNADNIVAGINNAAAKSGNLVEGEDELNTSISNIDKKTANIAQSGVDKKLGSIQKNFNNLGKSFGELNASMKGLGGLLNDQHLYKSTSGSFDTLDRNWKELQKNPPGFSIFGGKKKKKN